MELGVCGSAGGVRQVTGGVDENLILRDDRGGREMHFTWWSVKGRYSMEKNDRDRVLQNKSVK